jgi:hypothetical protein
VKSGIIQTKGEIKWRRRRENEREAENSKIERRDSENKKEEEGREGDGARGRR